MLWIMALAEKTDPDNPSYAEDTSPVYARAHCTVNDFADLFPLLRYWRQHFDLPDVTAYAMSTPETVEGAPAPDTWESWDRHGPEIRLDMMPGGFIEVRDVRDDYQPWHGVSTQVIDATPPWPPVATAD